MSTNVAGAGNSFSSFSGTSAAAPHIAAVIALMRESYGQNSTFTFDLALNTLTSTAHDRGPTGRDRFWGAGFVRAFDAVGELM